MRALLALAFVFLTALAARPAHAFIGAIGYLGYGHTFGDDGGNFGPTLELGGSISLPLIALDVTYWTDLNNASDSSQVRIGGRIKPPIIPLYGRAAIGLPLDSATRDNAGLDVVLGVGYEVFSLPLISIVLELDYNRWTGIDVHPFEIKAGAALGF